MYLHVCVYNQAPALQKHTIKRTGSPVPTVPELYKIQLIIWTLVYCFHKIVCHIWLDSKAGHYINIVAHHECQPFSTLYGNRNVQKCTLILLTSPSTPHPPKYTRSHWNTDVSILYQTHKVVVLTLSTLEGLHSIFSFHLGRNIF